MIVLHTGMMKVVLRKIKMKNQGMIFPQNGQINVV